MPGNMFSCVLTSQATGRSGIFWIEKETETEWHARRCQTDLTWRDNPLEILSKAEWVRDQPTSPNPRKEHDPQF